jgi:hypothetical protein
LEKHHERHPKAPSPRVYRQQPPVYDFGHNEDRAVDLLNWDAIVAAILVIGVGAGFWTGVGLMIAHLWK